MINQEAVTFCTLNARIEFYFSNVIVANMEKSKSTKLGKKDWLLVRSFKTRRRTDIQSSVKLNLIIIRRITIIFDISNITFKTIHTSKQYDNTKRQYMAGSE
jgi:hypothetical protein